MFGKKRPTDLETIGAKLADAETARADAQDALRQASIAAALEADPLAATQAQRYAVADAEARVELLREALAAAEDAERKRLDDARAKAWQSQIRSQRQKIGQIDRAALEFETALQNAMSAFRRMVLAGRDIDRLLPQGREWNHFREALRNRVPQEAVDEFHALMCAHENSGEIRFPLAVRPIGYHPSTHTPLHLRLKALLLDHHAFLTEDPEPPEHMAAEEPSGAATAPKSDPAAVEVAPDPEQPTPEPPLAAPTAEFLKRQDAAARGIKIDDLVAELHCTEEEAEAILDAAAKPKPHAEPSVADMIGGAL